MKGNGLLFLLLGVGALVWYESSQNSAPATTDTSGGSTPPTPPTSTTATTVNTPTGPVNSYSGPSLSQMWSALQSVIVAQLQNDPALVCPGSGMQGLGVGTGSRSNAGSQSTANGTSVGPHGVVAGGIPARTSTSDTGSRQGYICDPTTVQATYEVFNYYLLQAAPSIGTVPNAPDGDPTVSLASYWAWAAPQLQSMIPGLSGMGAMLPLRRLSRPTANIPKSYYYGGMTA